MNILKYDFSMNSTLFTFNFSVIVVMLIIHTHTHAHMYTHDYFINRTIAIFLMYQCKFFYRYKFVLFVALFRMFLSSVPFRILYSFVSYLPSLVSMCLFYLFQNINTIRNFNIKSGGTKHIYHKYMSPYSVMVIDVGNGNGNLSSNPGGCYLHII